MFPAFTSGSDTKRPQSKSRSNYTPNEATTEQTGSISGSTLPNSSHFVGLDRSFGGLDHSIPDPRQFSKARTQDFHTSASFPPLLLQNQPKPLYTAP